MHLKKSPPEDSFKVRCPKLGHQIHFSYCRSENFALPCARTLICWHSYFMVEEYLRGELNSKEWSDAFECQPKHKTVTLLELIEQAQKRKEEEGG